MKDFDFTVLSVQDIRNLCSTPQPIATLRSNITVFEEAYRNLQRSINNRSNQYPKLRLIVECLVSMQNALSAATSHNRNDLASLFVLNTFPLSKQETEE